MEERRKQNTERQKEDRGNRPRDPCSTSSMGGAMTTERGRWKAWMDERTLPLQRRGVFYAEERCCGRRADGLKDGHRMRERYREYLAASSHIRW